MLHPLAMDSRILTDDVIEAGSPITPSHLEEQNMGWHASCTILLFIFIFTMFLLHYVSPEKRNIPGVEKLVLLPGRSQWDMMLNMTSWHELSCPKSWFLG